MNSIEFLISETLICGPLNIPPTVLANRGHIEKNSDFLDLANKSFYNVPASAVSCATLALFLGNMLVTSVEILTLSVAIYSFEVS